jgi:hypothetical protein
MASSNQCHYNINAFLLHHYFQVLPGSDGKLVKVFLPPGKLSFDGFARLKLAYFIRLLR